MSCGTLSREHCSTCNETTLHDRGACIHCKTAVCYDTVRDDPTGLAYSIRRTLATRRPRKRRSRKSEART
jgi:hypothetical protein